MKPPKFNKINCIEDVVDRLKIDKDTHHEFFRFQNSKGVIEEPLEFYFCIIHKEDEKYTLRGRSFGEKEIENNSQVRFEDFATEQFTRLANEPNGWDPLQKFIYFGVLEDCYFKMLMYYTNPNIPDVMELDFQLDPHKAQLGFYELIYKSHEYKRREITECIQEEMDSSSEK